MALKLVIYIKLVTALYNLYTASNILHRTFILKAEKLNWTCKDLVLTSKNQAGSTLGQIVLANEDLSVMTISFVEYVM